MPRVLKPIGKLALLGLTPLRHSVGKDQSSAATKTGMAGTAPRLRVDEPILAPLSKV